MTKTWHRKKVRGRPRYLPSPELKAASWTKEAPSPEAIAGVKGRLEGCRSKAERTNLVGVNDDILEKFLTGSPLHQTVLEEIDRNVFHREDGALRVRVINMIHAPGKLSNNPMRRLETIARLVQDYRKLLPYSGHVRTLYSFQPRLMIRDVAWALERAYWMFVRLHDECPEYDFPIFSQAADLLDEIRQLPKGIWRSKLKSLGVVLP